ncbi:MAG TPA: YceI family protein [Acidobacteriota bacterium]|nr:YceI family protein [Acidobacteriota bacterium]
MTAAVLQPLRARLPALVILLPTLAVPAFAQEGLLELDPARTRIEFTLGAALHTVHGTFRLTRGSIRFDTRTGKASGLVVVDVTSGETGSPARDRKMHREILESAKYPEAAFSPERVQGNLSTDGPSRVELHGVFHLHGSDHAVVLIALVQHTGNELSASIQFVIPYVEWGLKNPSTFILRVRDRVDIDIRAAGRIDFPKSQ